MDRNVQQSSADNRRRSKYALMNEGELIAHCESLYKKDGIASLLYENIKKHKGLYWALYNRGLSQKKLIQKLGLEEELKHYKVEIRGWTWNRILVEAQKAIDEQSFLPPAGWFQVNGKSGLVYAVYNLGKTWEDLRKELDSFESSSFVESRNGMRWRSHPEASVSNFLYTRGIKHSSGKKYPSEYAEFSNQSYGYYDLAFLDSHNHWIDVEIWGDNPKGHGQEHYAKKRLEKEQFNFNNQWFLGIEFKDCFEEDKLTEIFKPYIGVIEPHIFDKPTDSEIPSTHWSNADELIEYCREIASQQDDGIFPTEEWLRKRGKWANRPGDTYNTLSIYIKTWLGGMRNLRCLIGQSEHSTLQWDRDKAIAAYQDWFNEYGCTPGQSRHNNRPSKLDSNQDVYRRAANICNAVVKYAGGEKHVRELLGIKINKSRKWSREKIIKGYKQLYEQYRLTPNQIVYQGQRKDSGISTKDKGLARQLVDVTRSYFNSSKEVWAAADINPNEQKWTLENVNQAYLNLYAKYGLRPVQIIYEAKKGNKAIKQEDVRLAKTAVNLMRKFYAGEVEICSSLGIPRKRQKRRK